MFERAFIAPGLVAGALTFTLACQSGPPAESEAKAPSPVAAEPAPPSAADTPSTSSARPGADAKTDKTRAGNPGSGDPAATDPAATDPAATDPAAVQPPPPESGPEMNREEAETIDDE